MEKEFIKLLASYHSVQHIGKILSYVWCFISKSNQSFRDAAAIPIYFPLHPDSKHWHS